MQNHHSPFGGRRVNFKPVLEGFKPQSQGDGSPNCTMSTVNGVLQQLKLWLEYSVINTRGQFIYQGFNIIPQVLKGGLQKKTQCQKQTTRIPSMLVDFCSSMHEMEDTFKMEFKIPS